MICGSICRSAKQPQKRTWRRITPQHSLPMQFAHVTFSMHCRFLHGSVPLLVYQVMYSSKPSHSFDTLRWAAHALGTQCLVLGAHSMASAVLPAPTAKCQTKRCRRPMSDPASPRR
jgi:hypothetical protein